MPRQARIDIAGRHYVTNRGKANRKIFQTDAAKRTFLKIVCNACERYAARINAYILTDDAYHLIVETSKPNLSLLMRQISSGYSIDYNRRQKNRGSIWHDRFASWVMTEKKETHLVQRYFSDLLHAYVRGDKNPTEYEFAHFFTLSKHSEMPECFDGSVKKKKLETFLESKFEESDKKALRGLKRSKEVHVKEGEKSEEDREPLEKILKKIKGIEKRNKKIKKAFHAGYSQNRIARFLGLSQSSVSKIVNAPAPE